MTNLIFIVLLICTNILIAEAKNNSHIIRDSVTVYFRQGYSAFDPSFSDNYVNMAGLIENINRHSAKRPTAQYVNIIASTSPEGTAWHNRLLSEKRAVSVAQYLMQRTGIPEYRFTVKGTGVNWPLLISLVKDSEVKNKNEIVHILEHTPELVYQEGKPIDGKLRQLGMLNGGEAYMWLYEHLFPLTRNSSIIVEYVYTADTPVPEFETHIPTRLNECALYCHMPPITQPAHSERKSVYFALKTNLLYDAGLIPNIGGEIYLGRQWTISGYYKHAWWKSDRKHWYWRTYGGELAVRKWLGRKAKEKPLTGHHLGIYGDVFTYDFETGGQGVLADKFNYTAGIEYGYSLPVARRINLDFVIGLGYMGGEYKEYEPTNLCYAWTATKKRHWIGPTKAEIALVWLIGHNNHNKRKGGEL